MKIESRVFHTRKPLKNFLILAVAAALGGTALIGRMTLDFLQSKDQLAGELAELQDEARGRQKDVDQLDQLLKKYPQDIAKFEEILFKDKDIPQFLEGLSGLSRKFNVSVRSISRSRASSTALKDAAMGGGGSLQSAAFQISIEGAMDDLIKFLLEMEGNRQLLTISGLNMSVEQYPLISCSFELSLYSLNPASIQGAAK